MNFVSIHQLLSDEFGRDSSQNKSETYPIKGDIQSKHYHVDPIVKILQD